MRIGFLLLSADPLHVGHIALATKCLNESLVDKAYITPCVQNPWKDMPKATFKERCDMINTICQFIDNCELEDCEKDLFPPYYSCNTLDLLYKKYDGEHNELFIIGGADTVESLPSWLNYVTMIKGRFAVIAFTREGQAPKTNEVPYTLVESDFPDLSSTMIRRLISEGKNPFPYIPECILDVCLKIYGDVQQTTEFYI